MSQSGLGAMLHYLSGGSAEAPSKYYGRVIASAELREADEGWRGRNGLVLKFADGVEVEIFDDGQSCCEARYMRTDDDLSSLVGATLVRIETKDGPTEKDGEWDDVHEQIFVEVGTDKGFVTLANHNEHNGYYGGFGLTIKEVEA